MIFEICLRLLHFSSSSIFFFCVSMKGILIFWVFHQGSLFFTENLFKIIPLRNPMNIRKVHWLLIYHILVYSWLVSTLNMLARYMQARRQAIVFLIEGFTDIIATKQPWNDNICMAKELTISRAFIILHPWANADLHFLCQLMSCKDRI